MTFAQEFTGREEAYLSYDFDLRKRTRDPRINKKNAKENLLLLKNILDKNDIKFWLLYGTLLGAVREQDFITHDTDTDLGMFFSDITKLIEIKPHLENEGFQLIRTKYPDDLITFMRNDEYIDLGLFRPTSNLFAKFWVYQKNKEKYSYFKKFDEINLFDTTFLAPYNHLKFLEEHYGKNWRVPIKNFPQITMGFSGFKRRVKYLLESSRIGRKLVVIYKKIIN